MSTIIDTLPTVILQPGEADRIVAGHPWVYHSAILRLTAQAGDGEMVQVKDHRQRLLGVELPIAMPLILEGVKLSLVINIGTATIGSTVAAKGLGEVIIAGLLSNNTAFILQGGLVTGLMAVLLYDAIGMLERRICRSAHPA